MKLKFQEFVKFLADRLRVRDAEAEGPGRGVPDPRGAVGAPGHDEARVRAHRHLAAGSKDLVGM